MGKMAVTLFSTDCGREGERAEREGQREKGEGEGERKKRVRGGGGRGQRRCERESY